jgi:uncharacterized phage protein (TIGR01671 family)
MLNIWPYQWQKGIYQSTGAEHLFFDNKFKFSDDNKECNRIEGKSVFISLDGTIVGLSPIDELTTRSIDYSEEYEIMQFTGLKDKKGKEIYEGYIYDIYESDDANTTMAGQLLYPNCQVVFSEGCFCFMVPSEGIHPRVPVPIYFETSRTMIKKGNIYENPELLK